MFFAFELLLWGSSVSVDICLAMSHLNSVYILSEGAGNL